MQINSAKLIIEILNEETGELITREATLGDFKEVTKKTTTRTKKTKDDGSTEPKATLLEGKLQLNNRAVELTGFEPEMKISISFEKKGRVVTPLMMEDPDKGNRFTKSFTISCRGKNHDSLAEYGTEFDVVPYENRNGVFKLVGDAPAKVDDYIDVPEEIESEDALDEALEDFSFDLED